MAKQKSKNRSKAEYAELRKTARKLYVEKSLTQQEICDLLELAIATVNKWCREDSWVELRKMSNLSPERLQSEVMSEINKLIEAGRAIELSFKINRKEELETLLEKVQKAVAEFNKNRIKHLKDLYNIYSDLAKSKGDLAQHMQGFKDLEIDLIAQGRIEEAKQLNLLTDEYVKKNI